MKDVLEFSIQCRCSKWPPSASKHWHNLLQRYWWIKSVYIFWGYSVYIYIWVHPSVFIRYSDITARIWTKQNLSYCFNILTFQEWFLLCFNWRKISRVQVCDRAAYYGPLRKHNFNCVKTPWGWYLWCAETRRRFCASVVYISSTCRIGCIRWCDWHTHTHTHKTTHGAIRDVNAHIYQGVFFYFGNVTRLHGTRINVNSIYEDKKKSVALPVPI
jgi:hypothetical protein